MRNAPAFAIIALSLLSILVFGAWPTSAAPETLNECAAPGALLPRQPSNPADDPFRDVRGPLGQRCVGVLGAKSVELSPTDHCQVLTGGLLTCTGLRADEFGGDRASGNVVQVALGNGRCVLLVSADVECDWRGTIGYDGHDAVSVSVGGTHACVVTTARDVACWLTNECCVSYGAEASRWEHDAVAVSAGTFRTCALLTNGNTVCWGDEGQGSGGLTAYAGGDAVAVSAGLHNENCVLRTDGKVLCDGRFGAWVAYAGGDAVAMDAAGNALCVLTLAGNVRCTGASFDGASGRYDGGDAVAVSVGADDLCILLRSGSVECQGRQLWGQAAGYTALTPPI